MEHPKIRMIGGGKRRWYTIKNAAEEEAEVYLYDEVGFWGVDAGQFVRDFAAIQASRINLRINSPGGNVFDGMAMYHAIRRHPARVTTYVDGLAASMASVIALAGDEVRIARGGFFMIHNPWAGVVGDAEELRKAADTLDKVTDSIVDLYADRTGRTKRDIRAMMDAETWMDADEAVEGGFADTVFDGADVEARWDLSGYRNVPERIAALTNGRSGRKIETIRDFETFLRDVGGFSHAEAKRIASGGFKAAPDPRDEDGGLAELRVALERRGQAIPTLTR